MSKFGWNLPPGAANDPNAPWNQPEPPDCPECGEFIAQVEDHDDDCPRPIEPNELAREAKQRHMKDADDIKIEKYE